MSPGHDSDGLTEHDRRGIAAIRRQLDAEFGPPEPQECPPRWGPRRIAAAATATALILAAALWLAVASAPWWTTGAERSRASVIPLFPVALPPGGGSLAGAEPDGSLQATRSEAPE